MISQVETKMTVMSAETDEHWTEDSCKAAITSKRKYTIFLEQQNDVDI